MNIYNVSEIFLDTIQGEGMHQGRSCAFLRFQYCNLWKSPEKPSVTCPWCDTKQLHDGYEQNFEQIKATLSRIHRARPHQGLVISGGEPMMQLDQAIVDLACSMFPWVDVETNGTMPLSFTKPRNLYISCSPKTSLLKITQVDWYKVLIPDKGELLSQTIERAAFEGAVVFVQPVEIDGYDSPTTKQNIQRCLDLCSIVGTVRLSIQIHKLIGVR